MKFVKILDLRIGDVICVKEPNQRWSHDCYIFKGIKGNDCLLAMWNDDDDDGTKIAFPINDLEKCRIWRPEQFSDPFHDVKVDTILN